MVEQHRTDQGSRRFPALWQGESCGLQTRRSGSAVLEPEPRRLADLCFLGGALGGIALIATRDMRDGSGV